jgi:glycine amidinotransferase
MNEDFTQMNKPISVNFEWGSLKEAIVGINPKEELIIPKYDESFSWLKKEWTELSKKHGGERMLDVMPSFANGLEQEIDDFADLLKKNGVIVHRMVPLSGEEADYQGKERLGLYARDPIFVIGNHVIEASLKVNVRRKERYSIRPILEQRCGNNPEVKWISMPPASPIPGHLDHKSAFLEGGDVFVNGHEIYVGMSDVASNRIGVTWLQNYLGKEYKVYGIQLKSTVMHLDGVMGLVKPGLGIICKDLIVDKSLPGQLKTFEWIEVSLAEKAQFASNGCPLNKETIIMTKGNDRVVKEVEKRGVKVITMAFEAGIALGGAFRCAHHPLYRADD